ncbi:MAG TPA: hypothetical protein DDY34_03960 [Bacteroidales bacterium]|nr:hypothetical protein [Bacteroidales bacterium]HBQ83385.1 hypothetical protein [Bacteroidales bacterium]
MMTICSLLPTANSRLTAHGSRLTTHDSRLTHHSPLTTHLSPLLLSVQTLSRTFPPDPVPWIALNAFLLPVTGGYRASFKRL